MDRLPQEYLNDVPKIEEMEIGEVRWINSVFVDKDGIMYVLKSAKTMSDAAGIAMAPYAYRMERLEDGWKIFFSKPPQPLTPTDISTFVGVCFMVTEIELV